MQRSSMSSADRPKAPVAAARPPASRLNHASHSTLGLGAGATNRPAEITLPTQAEKVTRLEGVFRQCGLRLASHRQVKTGDHLMCTWEARGTPRNHEALLEALLDDPDVHGFRY